MKMEPGKYQILRVDGSAVLIQGKPTLEAVRKLIGCECIDTVILDRKSQTVMLVDDTGMIDGKPVNAKATELYHAVCKPGTIHAIHGDVAIVNDRDFE